ncbi:YaiO family outer membrane beta-barrel protein [Brevundimonas sp.]|jgi:YaiO family outer membrane protein|uniref:YaiO family outer membrane beta-barrel protein n=1 Tax=Brevundimonas sp. TaxID=1871086 RepID=UPI002E11A373|nr:tetratricopeptide repeat protein [Brevundimonas sp.]
MIAQDVPAEVRQDPTALYEAAVADRRAGRPARAAEALRAVLRARPDDVDARLQLGLALLDLGRLDEAEAELLRVVEQSPDYVDAHVALARTARRRGDDEAAAARAAEAARLAPDRADVRALLDTTSGPPRWRIDADVSRSRLGGGLSDWTEARISATRAVTDRWTVGGALERTERFDRADLYLEAQASRRLGGGEAWIALGGTPDADHRPELALRAGGAWRLAPAISVTVDGSVARFAAGEVTALQPGLAVDLFDGRVALAARWINVWDESGEREDGYAVSARWALTDRFRLRVDHADAPETSEGLVVDVSSLAVGGEWDLTERVSLRLGVLEEDRGAYDRRAVTVGLGWRFW